MDYDLLHFSDPPLVEVVLGIQFEPIEGFLAPHMGLLWSEFFETFPVVDVKPAVEPVVERFGVQPAQPMRIRISADPPPIRVWFQDRDGTELVQVQQDRFIHNWRRTEESGEYPRYPALVKRFIDEATTLERFLSAHRLASPRINQCELIYINVVRSDRDPFEGHRAVEKVFGPLSFEAVATEFGEIEDANVTIRHVLRNSEGSPVGRAHVSLKPAYTGAERVEAYRLEVSVRGEPQDQGLGGVRKFLDDAHEVCVAAFKGVTTEQMHKAWGMHFSPKEVVK